MKRSLVALAILGTFATSASAQTGVTIYGIIDAGIVQENGGPAGNVTKLTSGVQSGSRLGFKGNEDLGGGLSGKFLLESGFNIDTGTMGQASATAPNGLLYGRQAYVGLGSNWGNLLLGRQETPHYIALREIDPFHAGLAGTSTNLVSTVLRMNNTIKYTLPDWRGFNAELAYGFGEVPDNTSANRQYGASIGYANGPLVVKLAHQRVENLTGTGHVRNTLLGGSWDFGVAAINLAANLNKGTGVDSRDYLVGFSVPFGPSTLIASYIRKDDHTVIDQDASQWALGYTYAVSKRTNFYASYGSINDSNGAPYTVGNATEAGSGDKAFNIGLRHTF